MVKKQKKENIFLRALKDYWTGYFKPKGKLDVKTFTMETLLFFIASFVTGIGLGLISPDLIYIAKIIGVILFIPMVMAGMRRIQDSGKSFMFTVVMTILFVAVCVFVSLTQFYLATEIMDIVMLILVFSPAPKSKKNNK